MASLLELPKKYVKRLLSVGPVKKLLVKAKQLHQRYQKWLFNTRLVKVDREDYLRHRLGHSCTPEEIEAAIATTPVEAIGKVRTNKLINRCIWRHSAITALCSAAAAFTSNTYLQIVMIVFDMLQFQLFTYIVVQKLLYLHGYHDLVDEEGKACEKAAVMLSAISLLMIGRHKVGNLMKKVFKSAAKKVIRAYTRVGGRVILTNLLRQCFKWLGVTVTRDTLTLSATILIGVTCSILAGIISFWLFFPMCKRLNRRMEEHGVIKVSQKIQEDFSNN